MLAIERHNRILGILKENGSAAVSVFERGFWALPKKRCAVTLKKMEKNGELIRTHGGAVSVDQTTAELSYNRRFKAYTAEKVRIAKEASRHINPFDTVFIDASTTAYYLANEIKKTSKI
ncbi:MAG: hypothetical protein L6V93_16785 [Clostridiales bacterium]|nr:MAG: hypothetical protein L6V93_16785 [Clostridiales bacterium]